MLPWHVVEAHVLPRLDDVGTRYALYRAYGVHPLRLNLSDYAWLGEQPRPGGERDHGR